jgi:hypothetical protein
MECKDVPFAFMDLSLAPCLVFMEAKRKNGDVAGWEVTWGLLGRSP